MINTIAPPPKKERKKKIKLKRFSINLLDLGASPKRILYHHHQILEFPLLQRLLLFSQNPIFQE